MVQHSLNGKTTHLTMLADEKSYKTLTECKGNLKYRFGRIKLILKNSAFRASPTPALSPSPSPTIHLSISALPLATTVALTGVIAVAAVPVASTSAAGASSIPKLPAIVVTAPKSTTGRTRPVAGSGRPLSR